MVSKEGIEEQKGLLIFSNFQFIISIEGVVQIEENLKASPESLLGHIEIGFKDVPSSDRVFAGKDMLLYSFMMDVKSQSFQVLSTSLLLLYITQASL